MGFRCLGIGIASFHIALVQGNFAPMKRCMMMSIMNGDDGISFDITSSDIKSGWEALPFTSENFGRERTSAKQTDKELVDG